MDVLKACQGATLDQLPLEILHVICYYLGVPDILRLRRVSRYLNEVSRCRDVWSDAYRKAHFIRPPGPLISQSAHDLENALVPSFRVALNLGNYGSPSQTERPTRKLKEIQYKSVDLSVRLIFGRFLLVAFTDAVHCYDLDQTESDPSIVYSVTAGNLKSFHCVSAFDVEGRPFACVVLNEMSETTGQMCISICAVNVGRQSKVTFDLLHRIEHSTFDVNAVDLGPRVIVIQGRLPMGYDFDAARDLIVMDVHTRTQLLLPPVAHATLETDEMSEFALVERVILPRSISTSTHLLLAKSFYNSETGWITFFQAFALSPLDTHHSSISSSAPTPLRLSHSGIMSGIYVGDTVLLNDSVVDPITQDVLIAIRVHAFEHSRPNSSLLKHGILRLGATLTSNDHGVGTIAFQLRGSLGQLRATFFHPSFNGAGRVFHTHQAGFSTIISALEYDLRASGEGNGEADLSKVVERPCVLRFPTRCMLWDYDPYFGRLCVRSSRAEVNVIEVLDLAV